MNRKEYGKYLRGDTEATHVIKRQQMEFSTVSGSCRFFVHPSAVSSNFTLHRRYYKYKHEKKANVTGSKL